jgi:hypothetical protein
MYESFGLIGKQLPQKYKENFEVSSEGAYDSYCNSLHTVLVFDLLYCRTYNTTYTINSDRRVRCKF